MLHNLRRHHPCRYPALLVLMLIMGLLLSAPAAASAAGSEADSATHYLDLGPAFTVNVGEPGTRVSFAKVDITLRLQGEADLKRAEHHTPALRDILVALLSSQPLDRVQSGEAKEKLRLEALEQVQAFLEREEGDPLVTDLLFTSFIVQP